MSEVADERARQNSKWGQQNHPDGTGAASHPLYGRGVVGEWSPASVLAEVFTERTNERASGNGDRPLTWADILLEEVFEALAEHDTAPLRTELIQIAAVATQWAEAIDRRMIGVRAHG